MDIARFGEDTRHMIVMVVLSHESPVGVKDEKMRLFLTERGYQKVLETQDKGFVKIKNHANVMAGHLHYDSKAHDL